MICVCGRALKPGPGTRQICPFCRTDLTDIFRGSALRTRGSIPPITSTGPGASASVGSLRREIAKRQIDSRHDWEVRRFEPEVKPVQNVQNKVVPQFFEKLHEVHGELKLILFNLPFFEKNQIKWEIENGFLKVKSLRLDFQYQEEVSILPKWGVQEPEVKFNNGILTFSWGEKD